MSDANIPAGAQGPAGGPGGQPSEQEIRAYLAQLRQTDVNEIVAQAFSMLASGAEVKMGRRDARLLIDAAAAVADATGERLDERLTEQMDEALAQLRTGQVDAEGQLDQLREEGRLPDEEDNDLPAAGRKEAAAGEGDGGGEPAPGRSEGAVGTQRPSGSNAADRLWVPGR